MLSRMMLVAGFGVALLVVGCGPPSSDQAIADVNKTNMHRLSNLYVRYQTQNRWKGPKDEATFKAYLAELPPNVLSRMGIEPGTTEELFTSQQDLAPLKIRYGVRGNARGSNEAIIFETDGGDDGRRVAFTSMKVEVIADEARYNGLLNGSVKESMSNVQKQPQAVQ